jgi:hypothetical protein
MRMKSTTLLSTIVCLAIGVLVQPGLAQRTSAPAGKAAASAPASEPVAKFVQVKQDNPDFHSNELFQAYENFYSPRIALLKSKYKLDDIVKDETDEWKRILLLRHWLAEQAQIGNPVTKMDENPDAFDVLDATLKGDKLVCTHFSVAQHAILNSFGYVTRRLGAGPGVTGRDGFHGTNEVWVNKFSKWVMVDAMYDLHYEKDGVPQSALEIRDEVIKDGGKSLKHCFTPDGREVYEQRNSPSSGKPSQPDTYRWVDWEVSTNYFTNSPAYKPSSQVLYKDEFFSNNTWVRDGKQNWIIGSPYAIVTTNRNWIEWTPNVIYTAAKINADKVDIELKSFTPNFRSYQMQTDKGWEDCSNKLTIQLQKPANKFVFRTINLFGVTGPEYKMQFDWKEPVK